MKNLETIFNLLLFPFLLLAQYTLRGKAEPIVRLNKQTQRLYAFSSGVIENRKNYKRLFFIFFFFFSLNVNLYADDECGFLFLDSEYTLTLNSTNSSDSVNNDVSGARRSGDTDTIYVNIEEAGTVEVHFTNNTSNKVRFSYSENSCPSGEDGLTDETYTFTSPTDFNLLVYSTKNTENYTLEVIFTPSAPTCINSSTPFTTLSEASSVTSAGIYCFDLTGTTFSTYVDATGYTLAAIDFGNGAGTLPSTDELTDVDRNILNTTILGKLTDTTEIRISSSNAQMDVTTTNTTLISRVINNQTLKRGQSDNTINKGWSGTNAALITTNATCDKDATGLNNRIIHQCGFGGGFHWIPADGQQTIVWDDGEIADSVSFRLWVKAASNTAPTANAGADQSIALGSSATLTGSGVDTDGTIVGYQWTEGGTVLSTSASFTYTPTSVGSHTLTLTVTDDQGATDSDSVIVTATEAERPPVMNSIPTQSIAKNAAGNTIRLSSFVTLTNNDPILSYTLAGDTLPSGMSFSPTTGIISGTPTVEGDFNLTASARDNDGVSNIVSFTLQITPPVIITNGYRDFSLRFQQTLAGKMVTIGNTILVAPTDQSSNVCNSYTDGSYSSTTSNANNSYELCEYHIDDDVAFGTTRAELPIPDTGTKVIWAGLYWQALADDSVDVTAMQIKFKHENTTAYTSKPYETIGFDILDYGENVGHDGETSYSAFADITSYFTDSNLTGGYFTVGDIPVKEGKIDTLGTYGAWSLVVIYEDGTEPLQNFSVFDGWKQVDSDHANVDVDISGFYTPRQPENLPAIDIISTASVFAAEGDKHIANDSLTAQPSKKTSATTLTHTSGQTFDSSINTSETTTFDRRPNPSNNQGIDIQAFDLGTTGYDILEPEEDSIRFTFSSDQDRYWPSMIAFATELYVPEICYDYTVRIGEYFRISATDQNINTAVIDGEPVNIQFALRSEEADFVYFDTKARVNFSGISASRLSYNRDHAQMSPPTINTYFKIADGYDEIEANASIGQIAIGANVIGNPENDGGRIDPNETTYAILGYDVTGTDDINTHFDLIFNTKIQFDLTAVPVDYEFNTATTAGNNGYIPRCPTNPTYDPVYMRFNVERVDTHNEPLSSRYTLHTQVTGRPYQLDISSYLDDNQSSGAHTPIDFNGTVELEFIDAGGFQNSSSAGYDMVCEEPQAIGEGSLISFAQANTQSRRTVDVPGDFPLYDDSVALQSAAVRLWVLAIPQSDGSRSVVTHQERDKTNSNGGFTNIYTNQIDTNSTGNCTLQCSGTNSDCYECLKTYYAFPVCSRDNFSIRPASYHIALNDNGEDGSGTTVEPVGENKNGLNNLRLSAGYNYLLDINATNYQSDTVSKGYYAYGFNASTYQTLPSALESGSIAAIEFNDNLTCYDQNHTTLALSFKNSSLDANSTLSYDNAGSYKLWVADSNWTVVDQSSYAYKPVFDNTPVDDCEMNSASNIENTKAGCAVYSISGDKEVINMDFFPYQFNLDDVDVTNYPDDTKNYTFFTDLSNEYYDGTIHLYNEMSTSYVGYIIAQGADNTTLTNFTAGCAAEDLQVSTRILTNPSDINATSPLQRYLQFTNNVNDLADFAIGEDRNLTLPSAAFLDTVNFGKARILLHTTFQKPTDHPINPVLANYKEMNVTSPNAFSSSKGVSNYIPDGNNSADRNITYYFAKVTPKQETYKDIQKSWEQTPIFVDIYCFDDLNPIGTMCSDDFSLNTPSKGTNNTLGWYSATMFDGDNSDGIVDGTTDLEASTPYGVDASPSVTPALAVQFDDANGTQEDINVSLAGLERPTIVDIRIKPVPWLTYDPNDPNGYPHYRLRFIGPSTWIGVGSRGNVAEGASSKDNTRRMNW